MSDRTMSVIEESLLKVSNAQHSVLSEYKTKIGDKVLPSLNLQFIKNKIRCAIFIMSIGLS